MITGNPMINEYVKTDILQYLVLARGNIKELINEKCEFYLTDEEKDEIQKIINDIQEMI